MTFPSVPPPADGLARALGAARTRRLRKAGLTTGAAAVCVVVAALSVSSGGATSLTQQQDLARDPSPSATGRPPTTAVGVTGASPAPQASAVPGGPRQPVVAAPGGLRPAPTTPSGAARSTYRAPDLTYSDTVITLPSCPVGSSRPLCPEARTSAMPSDRRGAVLAAYLCSQRTSTTTLSFPSAREVDLWVTRSGVETWRWSRSHPDSDRPHLLTVDPRQCVSWQLAWDAVSSEGTTLADGDYVLHVAVAASEVQGEVASTAFTVRSA